MKWKFYFEGDEEGFYFFIEAENSEQAYDLAYESYGPQVEDMMYYLINPENFTKIKTPKL